MMKSKQSQKVEADRLKQDELNVWGVTRKNSIWATVLVLCFLGGACATSPTGRKQLILLPEGQLNTLGADAFQQMQEELTVETRRDIVRYVQCVADEVIEVIPKKQQPGFKEWEVRVFRDDSANAFALPGGKIGVHTGLLDVAETPAQLAAVLGHEVGHVLARHGNERVSQAVAAQGLLVGAGVLARDSQHRQTILAALGLGAQVGVLMPFGRRQESEADLIGLDLMARAGFDPRESVTLWENMAEAGGAQPPEFLSTHPSHGTRTQLLSEGMGQALKIYNKARDAGRAPTCEPPRRS
jgi:predicted Zn-dependent protease